MSNPNSCLRGRTLAAALAAGLVGWALAIAPAEATVLTFDQVRSAATNSVVIPTVSGRSVPVDYGDRVSAGVMDVPGGQFTYGEAGEGYTPNVALDIYSGAASTLGQGVSLWRDGYGDLANVLIGNNASSFLAVRLTADAGYQAGLYGFDLAGWPNADYVINGISVWGDAALLYSLADVAVEGDFSGPRHTAFTFGAGLFAGELLLTIDYSNLGAGQHDNIGLDNLRFGQNPPAGGGGGGSSGSGGGSGAGNGGNSGGGGGGSHAVPEPGTLPLIGLAAFAAWRVRRHAAVPPAVAHAEAICASHTVGGRPLSPDGCASCSSKQGWP